MAKKKTARNQAWSPAEIATLRRLFENSTNAVLAVKLGRTAKSVAYAAQKIGLTKTLKHRSGQSRETALAAGKTSEEMAALGSLGGKVGGPARAKSLTATRRKKIARVAVQARWRARDQSV